MTTVIVEEALQTVVVEETATTVIVRAPGPAPAGAGTGTVTSVNASGGTTGLSFSGGPVTESGTLTLAGTLAVASGGTGAATASGARTALGLGTMATQDASAVAITGGNVAGIVDLAVADGGTGASSASVARSNLGAAASGSNSDITALTGITGGIASPDFVTLDTGATTSAAVGRLRWDTVSGTALLGEVGGNVEANLGQTLDALVHNAEATTLTKGEVVYLFGASGDKASVKRALNTSDATSAKTFGVVAESISSGAVGLVRCVGVLEGLNLGGFTAGDTLYLGASAGTMTATKPVAPNHMVYVGLVERANAGNGRLYVRIQNGYELDELHDVAITSPAAGAVLVYDATNALWKDATITGSGGVTITNGDASIDVGLSSTGVGAASYTNASITVNAQGRITAASSGTAPVTSVTGTSPVASSGGATPAISLASGYGDTQNPYASKTANFVLAAPNGSAGVPTFRALAAADVPTLNQNTTGTAANVTGTVAVANGGTGATDAATARSNLTAQKTITSGTAAPSGGSDGDIYLQYT